jgi:uncharacterized damage-inducible protein DinB
MDAQLAASLAVLEEMYDSLIELIRPLDDDCLNWTPPVPEINSIAALTTHIAGSMNNWLTRTLGEPVVRDREAEFRRRAGAADLIATVEASRARAREQFARLDGVDRATIRRVSRSIPQPHEVDVTVGWCIEHAIIHAGEHWGQIQLTRQLWPAEDRQN